MEQWRKRKFYDHGQILLANDVLLVQCEEGEVALVDADPKAHKEFGRIDALDGRTWNNLCLYGRYLLVRNAEEAACYLLAVGDASEPETGSASSGPGLIVVVLCLLIVLIVIAIVAQSRVQKGPVADAHT